MGAVIVEAVRSAVGKRKGGLAGVHPADLSGSVLKALAERAGHRGEVQAFGLATELHAVHHASHVQSFLLAGSSEFKGAILADSPPRLADTVARLRPSLLDP